MKALDRFFEYFDVESFAGIGRLVTFSLVFMTVFRFIFNPRFILFPHDLAGTLDYRSMIGMSAILIALDAMLIVILSFRKLKRPADVLIVAGMVGSTHVVFPLLTFGVTAGFYVLSQRDVIPEAFAHGALSAIYFVAVVFVASHLREVHSAATDPEAERIEREGLASWTGVKSVWPQVFAVSIDALLVGPAKIGFIARYELNQFLWSFPLVGFWVFILVLSAGIAVIVLNKMIDRDERIAEVVRTYDFWSSQLLVIVFVHFTVFASAYLIFTFFPKAWLLSSSFIWGTTAVIGGMYLYRADRHLIREAARIRAQGEEMLN